MSWSQTSTVIERASVCSNLIRLEITNNTDNSYVYKINGRRSQQSYGSASDAKTACLDEIKTILENGIVEINNML